MAIINLHLITLVMLFLLATTILAKDKGCPRACKVEGDQHCGPGLFVWECQKKCWQPIKDCGKQHKCIEEPFPHCPAAEELVGLGE